MSNKLINKKGLRLDGRKPEELRTIKAEIGILERADSSAYMEQGKNKILAAVFGPRELHPKHLALMDRALLRCRYHMAPFSVQDRKSPAPSRREVEISKVITKALEPSVFTEYYPRTAIDVYIEVLQSDGGTRGVSITAASLALAGAGIPLRDLVSGCAAGKIEGQIVLDINGIEDQMGEADLPVAIMSGRDEITLLQMDGDLTSEEFDEALKLAIDGCRQIYRVQKEALKANYVTVEKEVGKVTEGGTE